MESSTLERSQKQNATLRGGDQRSCEPDSPRPLGFPRARLPYLPAPEQKPGAGMVEAQGNTGGE